MANQVCFQWTESCAFTWEGIAAIGTVAAVVTALGLALLARYVDRKRLKAQSDLALIKVWPHLQVCARTVFALRSGELDSALTGDKGFEHIVSYGRIMVEEVELMSAHAGNLAGSDARQMIAVIASCRAIGARLKRLEGSQSSNTERIIEGFVTGDVVKREIGRVEPVIQLLLTRCTEMLEGVLGRPPSDFDMPET